MTMHINHTNVIIIFIMTGTLRTVMLSGIARTGRAKVDKNVTAF